MIDADMEKLVIALAEYMRSHYFGKYRGTVTALEGSQDDRLGRIRASVPEVYGPADSPWAMPAVPFAGDRHGTILLPEMGDGVWIEFEAGDIARPVWTGCWWAGGEMPQTSGNACRTIVTTGGHSLVLDDDNNEVRLTHAGGAELTMTDSDITLKIGSAQIVLSSSGVSVNDGAFEVK